MHFDTTKHIDQTLAEILKRVDNIRKLYREKDCTRTRFVYRRHDEPFCFFRPDCGAKVRLYCEMTPVTIAGAGARCYRCHPGPDRADVCSTDEHAFTLLGLFHQPAVSPGQVLDHPKDRR